MQFKVYWQSSWLKQWKFCGGFNTFHQANEHIDYLTNHVPSGSKIKFRIDAMLKSFQVMSFDTQA
jgi:hypothetical protein